MNTDKKKALVVFHRVDYDGLYSYIVAKKALTDMGYEVDGFGYNYKDTADFGKYGKGTYDKLIVCDITLPCADMVDKLEEFGEDFIWIDHHETAIADSVSNGYSSANGIRKNGVAACELTWAYFHPDTEIPYPIRLAGAYDVWNKTAYDWVNVVGPFQLGLSTEYGINSEAFYSSYDRLTDKEGIEAVIEAGRVIKKYNDGLFESWVQKYAFEVTIGGERKGLCMIAPVFTSKVFESVSGSYGLYVVCEKDAIREGKYTVSMYADGTPDDGFSCGEYMKEHYGGGGHKGAAGGIMDEEEFIRLITKKEM